MPLYHLDKNQTPEVYCWWEIIYTYNDWKIQHHKTHLLKSELKPYRLLNPENRLIVSADSEQELKEYLDGLLKH